MFISLKKKKRNNNKNRKIVKVFIGIILSLIFNYCIQLQATVPFDLKFQVHLNTKQFLLVFEINQHTFSPKSSKLNLNSGNILCFALFYI